MGMATRRTRERPKSEQTDSKSRYRRMVGDRLYALRSQARMSAQEASNLIGWSQQAISTWERGERIPNAEALLAISTAYGVSLDWLLRAEDGDAVGIVNVDHVTLLCKAVPGKKTHPLWEEPLVLLVDESILPLHGVATIQSFRDAMLRVRERGSPDDIRDALAWVARMGGRR